MSADEIIQGAQNVFAVQPRGALATVNDDGSPCVIPVHLMFQDGFIYWFSKSDTRHSENLEREPRISLTLWGSKEGEPIEGVYVQSTVEILTGEAGEAAFGMLEQRLGSIPPIFAGTQAYRCSLGTPDEGHSSTGRWYFYS